MRKHRINKRIKIRYTLLTVILLSISLGFALLSTNLNITGTTGIKNATWNIHWSNLAVTSGSVSGTKVTTPAYIKTGNTEVEYSVTLSTPGDFYEFTVDAVNEGTVDAMIGSFSNKIFAENGITELELPDYLEYEVTYNDWVPVEEKQLLASGTTETYRVRVHFKKDIIESDLPITETILKFKFNINYIQKDNNSVAVTHRSFENDSWEEIISAVSTGNIPFFYKVGDTKTIDLGTLGTHTLRIANTTSPSDCNNENYSETACGFVLEFADIIALHNMNSSITNVGGWRDSLMRTYVNTDVYNAIPTTLKDAIIDTKVVSSHGSTSGEENFVTTDKLYLLSPREVLNYSETYDSAASNTRQLDYYNSIGTTTSSYSGAIKRKNDATTMWWLRTARSTTTDRFFYIELAGSLNNHYYPTQNYGVSPAFRIES